MLRPISFSSVFDFVFQLDSILCTVKCPPRAVFSSAAHGSAARDAFGSNGRSSTERALLFPKRCCQGHGAAVAASRGDQRNPATGSGGFVPRCWAATLAGGERQQ